jgi:AraC family transcriptional regulator, activator of mtrCDE
MLAAADMLRSTEASLDAIAGSVGYGSIEAFSRGFSRCLGSSPSAFRRASRPADRIGHIVEPLAQPPLLARA